MATNPFTSAQAGPSYMGGQTLTNPEIIALERQRKMAEMLLRKGMEGQPDSQMVSGYYVPPSWAQRLSPILDQTLGQQGLKDVDEKTAKLAEMLRQKESQDLSKFFELQYGGAPMDAQAGPMPDGGNIPINLSQPDPRAAFEMGMQSTSPLVRSQIAEMLKPQKLSAEETMTRYNPNTGRNEVVAKGVGKPRAPVSVGNYLVDPESGRVIFQAPEKPQAGQVVETANGPMLVNTRSGQATPIMADGQPLAAKPKPLPEGLNKQVTGSINLSDAINDYQTKIKSFGVKDFANPDKRAEMGNAYNNMMLQAKEAYNLGVLNGPDYDILQRVVRDPTNPSSLLFSNNALDKQAESLRNTAKNIVSNAYTSQGRDVPEDIAKKLIKPTTELKSFTSEQDVQKAIQTGTLKKGDRITINGVTGTIQ
jgi:hypothetical protein